MGNRADFEGLDDPYAASFRLALLYPNVWLEASTIGSPSNDPNGEKLFSVYRYAKAYGLTNRMIYGSDGPQFPGFVQSSLLTTITALERANYTAAEAQLVLEDNFNVLFGLW
jgi:uncharacterized protein